LWHFQGYKTVVGKTPVFIPNGLAAKGAEIQIRGVPGTKSLTQYFETVAAGLKTSHQEKNSGIDICNKRCIE
jgi:hypothetical protein